jgi:hypothetical protein
MIVTSTRADARRMAQAIAEHLERSRESRALSEFVRLRLGDEHPLVPVLDRGVAYHHAGLPLDVLEAIEDSVRADEISFIAATTSLTEGVNLPVRTVVLAETRYEGQPGDALLQGARLLNAMGRAGRACKECEGWVVLVENRQPNDADFQLLAVDQDQLRVESRLTDEAALEALAALEQALQDEEDALFRTAADEIGEFVSFVWFILAAEESANRVPRDLPLSEALEATLAFVQLAEPQRERWLGLAGRVRDRYLATEPSMRRRWARTGTTIGTARSLSELGEQLVALARGRDALGDVDVALGLLNEVGALERLVALPEAPRQWTFRRSSGGTSVRIEVDARQLLDRWVHGDSMAAMAEEFLAEVPSVEFRLEQTVDAITQHFEHFLSWMLGALLTPVNEQLAEIDQERVICPPLPLFVRYGVDSVQALELLINGIRSREFAASVGEAAQNDDVSADDMRAWIREMSIVGWRERFEATASDILDLLEFVRARRAGLLRTLLEEGRVSVVVETTNAERVADVDIHPAEGTAPVPLMVSSRDRDPLGRVPTGSHAEIQAVLDTGLELRGDLDGSTLTLALSPPDDDGE